MKKEQIIHGVCPSKSNCYKIVKKSGHASLAKTPKLVKYEQDFFIQCNKYRNKGISGHFEFYIDVYYPSQRHDLDNSLKIVLDTLQRMVKAFKNDNKCTKIVAEKYLDKDSPRVEFTIKPII